MGKIVELDLWATRGLPWHEGLAMTGRDGPRNDIGGDIGRTEIEPRTRLNREQQRGSAQEERGDNQRRRRRNSKRKRGNRSRWR